MDWNNWCYINLVLVIKCHLSFVWYQDSRPGFWTWRKLLEVNSIRSDVREKILPNPCSMHFSVCICAFKLHSNVFFVSLTVPIGPRLDSIKPGFSLTHIGSFERWSRKIVAFHWSWTIIWGISPFCTQTKRSNQEGKQAVRWTKI